MATSRATASSSPDVSMAGPPRPTEDASAILGPILIGTITGALLCGALLSQAVKYLGAYPYDKRVNKLVVGGVTVCSLLGLANSLGECYYTFILLGPRLVRHPGMQNLHGPLYFAPLTIASSGAATTLNQLFFSYRAVRLATRHQRMLATTLFGLCLVHGGISVAVTIWSATRASPTATDVIPDSLKQTGALSLGVGAFVDVTIAIVMFWVLRRAKGGVLTSEDFLSTRVRDNLVHHVLRTTFATGALTAGAALATGVTLVVGTKGQSAENAGVGLALTLPHITGLGVLATLNLRASGQRDPVPSPAALAQSFALDVRRECSRDSAARVAFASEMRELAQVPALDVTRLQPRTPWRDPTPSPTELHPPNL